MSYEFTDRYKAMGIPYPDPNTMCKGQCDGVGFYPQSIGDPHISPMELYLWTKEHGKNHGLLYLLKLWLKGYFQYSFKYAFSCDGYHFITCPDCKGTGKNNANQSQSPNENRNEI